jgi:hypothetical protein
LDGFNGPFWGDVFGPLNIRYLIIHYDIDWPTNLKSMGFTNEWVKTIAEKLKSDETLEAIYEGEYLTAFKIKNTQPLFTISSLALAQNGLPAHATLTSLTQNFSIIYSDEAVLSSNIMNFTDYILVGNAEDSIEQLLIQLANDKYLLQPTNFVEREIKPDVKWSYYTSSSEYSFQNQLRRRGIERWAWNFDYEKGFVATWASNVTLKLPFDLENSVNYQIFIRHFQNQEGGEIQVHLDDKPINVPTNNQVNKFIWKELGTVYLERGTHEVVIKNIDGLNAVNLFALIPTEEVNKIEEKVEDFIQNKKTIYILEAETDMYRENAPVSSKHDWQASNGEVIELLMDASKLWSDLEILNSGKYSIMIQCKGNLNVKLDDKDYEIAVTDLEWIDLDHITLDKGIHQLEITKPPLLPYVQLDFEKNQIQEWFNSRPEIQDLSRDEKAYEGKNGLKAELNASSGRWVVIQSPKIPITPGNRYVWDFFVTGENAHEVHARIIEYNNNDQIEEEKRIKEIGDGNFTWSRINFEYTPTQNASYISLEIRHGRETNKPLPNAIWIDNVKIYDIKPSFISDLDRIWIYPSQNESETLEDILNLQETTAEIIEFTKISSTKYLVSINSTEPFTLNFAQAYDPLWTADVNGEKINPIKLYNVINGFLINKTGELTITIEYEAQKWFFYGSGISITSIIISVVYLIWDLRKRRDIIS